ncbi:MAG: Dabb family protein, partial [Planctomycetota bacterium]
VHRSWMHFSVGPRAEQYQRPVNDDRFDVALLVVFDSTADHDRYQESERHQTFIKEQSDQWAQVRVFDSFG